MPPYLLGCLWQTNRKMELLFFGHKLVNGNPNNYGFAMMSCNVNGSGIDITMTTWLKGARVFHALDCIVGGR